MQIDHVGLSRGTPRRIPPMVRGALFVAAPWVALSFPAPWLVPLVLIVSLLAGALLVRDPEADRGALLMVAAFTVCDLSPFSVEGSVVRLYQLSVVVVLVVLLRRRSLIVRGLLQLPRLPMAAVATIVALTVLTPVSLLWTISPRDTLVSAVGQLSATGLLVLFAATISAGFLKARDVLTAVWAMATSSSLLACLQFTLTVLTPWELASAGGSGVPWPRPEGLMTEAVWAALVAAMGLALAFVVRRDHPHLAYGSLGVNAATLCLVGSRAVLLGMAVGSLVCGVVLWRRHMTPLRLSGIAAAALVGVLGLAVVAPGVLARFDPTLLIGGGSGADGGSAQSRAVVYKLVADELPSLLPLGAGAGSLNKLTTDAGVRDRYLDGGELNAGRGSTNFFLGYAFDFGYLGAALALTLVVVVGVLAFRTARWDHGLSVFLVTLFLIDFQFNNGFRFGFVHVMLAVLLGVSTRHAVRPLALSAGSKASA